MGAPRGPTKSRIYSPSFFFARSSVERPTFWKIIVTAPLSLSVSAIVRGILSPSSSIRKIINCPAFAFFAISGASISISVTEGLSSFFLKILNIAKPSYFKYLFDFKRIKVIIL